MTKYFTLAVCEDGIWAEQFGGYDLDVVRDERRDQGLPARLTAIIHSDDHQDKIEQAIAELNRTDIPELSSYDDALPQFHIES